MDSTIIIPILNEWILFLVNETGIKNLLDMSLRKKIKINIWPKFANICYVHLNFFSIQKTG